MSVKQDRPAVRSAEDLERKYKFGKHFAEYLGIANDLREDLEETSSQIRNEILNQSTALSRNAEQIVLQATREVRSELTDKIGDLSKKVETVIQEVALKVSAEDVGITVKRKMAEGIELETGFRFDADGLDISKAGEEMQSKIDNTGMYVRRDQDDVLVANNKGVEALNVHVKTNLVIGSGSGKGRLEEYGADRIGCFWIGG